MKMKCRENYAKAEIVCENSFLIKSIELIHLEADLALNVQNQAQCANWPQCGNLLRCAQPSRPQMYINSIINKHKM